VGRAFSAGFGAGTGGFVGLSGSFSSTKLSTPVWPSYLADVLEGVFPIGQGARCPAIRTQVRAHFPSLTSSQPHRPSATGRPDE
jgi:hypothetical protein